MSPATLPEVLVTTEWVAQHATDANVRVVEVDVDTTSYAQGHVPGAAGWNWSSELCDTLTRDIVPAKALEALLGRSGIDNKTTIVLYGDNNNWFAAWAFWQLKMYGHQDVRIMDGGRKKWIAEGRDLSTDTPAFPAKTYTAGAPDNSLRAFLPEVQAAMKDKSAAMVDVRGPQEFTGEILAPPGLPETCQRGGHIPGAKNIPWSKNCNDDGTFKSVDELKSMYAAQGITADEAGHCVLPDRRAIQPDMVRDEAPARLRACEELRWIVDGVGQPRRCASREAVNKDAG